MGCRGRTARSTRRRSSGLSAIAMHVIRIAALALLCAALATGGARADPRDDFLAGHSRACPKCNLAGADFKRRDLAGVDLTGADLHGANFHDAQLAGAKLA